MCISDEIKEIKKDLREYRDQNQQLLIKASDKVPVSISPIIMDMVNGMDNISRTLKELKNYNQTQDKVLSEILDQAKKTNSRINAIELWKAGIVGGGAALKGLWIVFGFLFVAGVFGIFRMYETVQQLPIAIHDEVEAQLDNYKIIPISNLTK